MSMIRLMKKICAAFVLFAAVSVSAQTANGTVSSEPGTESVAAETPGSGSSAAVQNTEKTEKLYDGSPSPVPAAKRPLSPDSEKAAAAAELDTEKDSVEKKKDTLKYGIESEITDLIDELIKNDDPRFADEIYDLFQTTRSNGVREKILAYFTQLKDPCLEDYAVTVLNDPYDTKTSTVSLVFKYIAAVKCTAAVNAVVNLLESDNTDYFSDALTTLGEIGGDKEAVYLSGYLDRSDITLPQRQQLMKVLGKLKAVKTWDKLVKIAEDENENSFVRMYAAEAIGEMQKKESIPVLVKLYESDDPNFRQYVINGLSNYSDKDAGDVIVQAIRDQHYKVRLAAVAAVRRQKITDAVPYLIYRAENDSENVVRKACYAAIADLNTGKGNEFLVSRISGNAVGDDTKANIASVLMEYNHAGEKEILALAGQTLKDDRRKQLRYILGKLFAKYGRSAYAEICGEYLASQDVATCGTGLDIYRKGRYRSCRDAVQAIADNDKAGVNQVKAERILGGS